MSTAMSRINRPLYSEARAYCEKYGVESLDELEEIRLFMCAREYRERMRPLNEMLVKAHPLMYSVTHEGPLPEAYEALQALVKEIAQRTASDLGLKEMQ